MRYVLMNRSTMRRMRLVRSKPPLLRHQSKMMPFVSEQISSFSETVSVSAGISPAAFAAYRLSYRAR